MSFANFTKESCTGTGNTLVLAGAVDDNLEFKESYEDGAPVSYTVKDSGGIIKITGIGTYVSATDDIIRNDDWSWNGTVVNKLPGQANITLSGGTHTISCDSVDKDFQDGGLASGKIYMSSGFQEINASTTTLSATETIIHVALKLERSGIYDAFAFRNTATGANVRIALYEAVNGRPGARLAVRATDFATGGASSKEVAFDDGAIPLKAGDYFMTMVNDGATTLRAAQSDSKEQTVLGNSTIGEAVGYLAKSLAYATPADPADFSSMSEVVSAMPAFGLRAA